MLSQGKITQADTTPPSPPACDLKITPARQGCADADMAPYFCDYVSHLILNNPAYGADAAERERKLFRGGLTITTTLDSRLQAAAQAQVDATAGANPDKWGAVAGLRRSRAPARSSPWRRTPCSFPQPGKFDTQLNFNVDSKDANGNDLNGAGGFQPGSTMKPFTFAEWLNEGKSMTPMVDASRRTYPLGLPLEVQLRQGARRLQHRRRKPASAPRTTCRTTTRATTAACPSTTGCTTPSTPPRSPRPPSWTSAASRRWWTPSGIHSGAGQRPGQHAPAGQPARVPRRGAAAPGQRVRHLRQRRQVLRADRHRGGDRRDRDGSFRPRPATAATPSSPRWPAA